MATAHQKLRRAPKAPRPGFERAKGHGDPEEVPEPAGGAATHLPIQLATGGAQACIGQPGFSKVVITNPALYDSEDPSCPFCANHLAKMRGVTSRLTKPRTPPATMPAPPVAETEPTPKG